MANSSTSPLIVVVSGGGPVGLTFSLNLVMMMGKHAKIIIYEGRWFVDADGIIHWQGEDQGKNRRDQVVTLQDHVIEQMPLYIQKGLFENVDERVWPTSRNIPIREVEDRLFTLLQPFVQSGQVELIAEQLHEQTERLVKGSFDVLVGADGSNSFVRRYCNIPMVSEGIEYACGVAYNIPMQVPKSEEPLHQALNCVLTVAQTRYLVNSSTSRRGYLNIRLIQSEYDELRERLKVFHSCSEPIDLLDVNQCPNSSLIWTIVRQGLEFFKIPAQYVFRVLPIEINVRHASIVVRELRFEVKEDGNDQSSTTPTSNKRKKYKTTLVCLAGDAALNVHFWPGRGMNSGMKAAMALARNIVRSCTSKTSSETIIVRTPLRFLDFIDYEGFMARLRAREQQGRSLRVLIDPIDQSVIESYSYAGMNHCYVKYTKRLMRKLQDMRQRLQERSDWPHQNRPITDEELQHASNRVSPNAVAQLSLANPWPTREMSGAEVVVEETFPFDQRKFLPVPEPAKKWLVRLPSVFIQQRFLSLWIVDEPISENIKKTINAVQNLPNFSRLPLSQVLLTTNSLNNVPREESIHLVVVYSIDEAKEWIVANRESIRKPGIFFKVVTVWSLPNQMTAVDAIRAIRTEELHVPVLILTNNQEETRPALEFPNIIVTDSLFDLYEFIGANQETQWNAGCRVSHLDNNAFSKQEKRMDGQQQQLRNITDSTSHKDKPSAQYKTKSKFHLLDGNKSSDEDCVYPKALAYLEPAVPHGSHQNLASFCRPLTRSYENHSGVASILLWIDSDTNDPVTTEQLRQLHPQLEIYFAPTFNEARTYLNKNLRSILHRQKFLVICREQYKSESKNILDVINLLDEFSLTVPLGVYTSDQVVLSQRIPNVPKHIQVFDNQEKLLAFVQDNLNK